MTTKRIDELTAATELTGDDLLPIMDGAATTKKPPPWTRRNSWR